MGDNTVLQQQLRNAGQQVEGTGTLLLQAADEINSLKQQLTQERARREVLEKTLVEVRHGVVETVGKAIGK